MKVQKIMTRSPRCCSTGDNLHAVARMMLDDDIGDVPVVDGDDKLVGIVTDRDIVVRCVAIGAKPEDMRVQECMTAPAMNLHPDDDVQEVANLMASQQVRRVPITDADDVVCGIVSIADIEHTDARSSRDRVAQRVATPH